MVVMLLRWKWKGEKKGEKRSRERERERKTLANESFTIPGYQTTRRKKVQQVYIYPHHTYTHIIQVCTELYTDIPEISTSTFPPRYHTNPSFQHTRHNTLLLHLHLVSLIIIIHEQAPRRLAAVYLIYLPYLQRYMVQHTRYIHIHK